MNLVVDDTLEMGPGGQQNSIGMVVSKWACVDVLIFLLSEKALFSVMSTILFI